MLKIVITGGVVSIFSTCANHLFLMLLQKFYWEILFIVIAIVLLGLISGAAFFYHKETEQQMPHFKIWE
ncbi:MAG: hypothetical protein Q8899_01640 [Weeping tea tree witches'-broom phytoplasma]|uniref:hypothetical protein n=1 Tax=Candidatus Phytoplasma melaleucae TaxID=2982630 RepID=UPI002939FBDB|nr:hypothetical protein [Weeping tea tree witches'-broom phytoplasma]